MLEIIWNLLATWMLLAASSPLAFMTCCCTQACVRCDSGTTPNQFQVDIANMVNDGCGSCTSLEGTYILDNCATIGDPLFPLTCRWTYVLPSSICTFHHLLLNIEATSPR